MTESTKTEAPREERAPDDPTDLPMGSWGDALRRTVREFRDDNLTDWAAALTYYGILVDLPGAARAGLGAGADRATRRRSRCSTTSPRSRPGPAQDIVTSAIQNLQSTRAPRASLFDRRPRRRAVVGVRLCRRLHARVERDLRRRARAGPSGSCCPLQLVITLVLMLLLVAIALSRSSLTGGLAEQVGERARPRRHGRHGLGHRQVAGAAAWS